MRKKIIAGLFLFLVLIGVYRLLSGSDVLNLMMDGDALQAWVVQLGLWGPLAIVALMILAVVWSPIPSAPVALAAGAAYGHTWGALYVLLGAELGALIAFALARWLGQDVIKRWFGKRLSPGWTGSQNILMLLVFITRLLPFVSFDIMSYAAGLTALTGWRFAVATLAGIVPASFLLAHFGSEMASGNAQRVVTTVLLVLGFASLPFLIGFVRHQSHRGVPGE
jgi:uncharacterized membrane protein YdjX (TVP38/TMEM64 family)